MLDKVRPSLPVNVDARASLYVGQRLLRLDTATLDGKSDGDLPRLTVLAAQETALALRRGHFASVKPHAERAIELLLKAREYYLMFLSYLARADDSGGSGSAKRSLALIDASLAAEFLAAGHYAEALTEAEKHLRYSSLPCTVSPWCSSCR